MAKAQESREAYNRLGGRVVSDGSGGERCPRPGSKAKTCALGYSYSTTMNVRSGSQCRSRAAVAGSALRVTKRGEAQGGDYVMLSIFRSV